MGARVSHGAASAVAASAARVSHGAASAAQVSHGAASVAQVSHGAASAARDAVRNNRHKLQRLFLQRGMLSIKSFS